MSITSTRPRVDRPLLLSADSRAQARLAPYAEVSAHDGDTVHAVTEAFTNGRKIENMTPGQASARLIGVEEAAGFAAQNPQAVNEDIMHAIHLLASHLLASDVPAVTRAAHPH